MSETPIQAFMHTLTSPNLTFDVIKSKKGWSWLPFLLILTSVISVYLYYFNSVDFYWLKEQLSEQLAASKPMTDEELKTVSSFYNKETMMWGTVIGGLFSIVFINLISAIYYSIINKVSSQNGYKFTDWFAFTWWTSIPLVLSMLVAALVIVFNDNGMVSLQDLQPTSFNSLIFSFEISNPWFSFFESLNLFNFWVIGVATIGLVSWLNIVTKKALILAAAPSVVIYGCWALYIALLA